jgi:hypothetical protein
MKGVGGFEFCGVSRKQRGVGRPRHRPTDNAKAHRSMSATPSLYSARLLERISSFVRIRSILQIVEAYETETTEIVKRFLRHRLNFPDCISALDAALACFVPRLTSEQISRLRIIVLANNEIVMKEMEQRSASGSQVLR